MNESTLQPFSIGDVFVAATLLNNPADDHAGRGRIVQYGADLKEKGTLWLEQTGHLVGGLKFDPRGVLWAFDSHDFVVLNIHAGGRVERRDFGTRPFSHVNFLKSGELLLAEHVVGDTIKPEVAARMHTTIHTMPGSKRFGDGHVWKFTADGRLLQEYATETHGGMGGFLGVTMSALSPDQSTLVYCSETGPRLLRYDLKGDRQLPDLQRIDPPFPPGPPPMFFGMEYASDGKLYVLRGRSIHLVDDAGRTTREIALEGSGWALMDISRDARYAFVSSFFSGEVAKIDLASGAKLGSIQTGAPKAVAGLVEYQGEGL